MKIVYYVLFRGATDPVRFEIPVWPETKTVEQVEARLKTIREGFAECYREKLSGSLTLGETVLNMSDTTYITVYHAGPYPED